MRAVERSLFASCVLLTAVFAVLLCAPLAGWFFGVRSPSDWQELRAPATWPDWAATRLADWPAKFEAWLNDHFAFRPQLLRAHATVRHRWLGAPSNLVAVGREDWLFYTGDHSMEDFVGRDPFTPAELARWRDVLEGRRAWLRERGSEYLFVIVPNKATVYPDKLPRLLARQRGTTRADQLMDYLRVTGSTVPVLDLRPSLLAARAQGPVYWIADSHWNGHGLALACDRIADRVRALGVPGDPRDLNAWLEFRPVNRIDDCVDLLALRGRWPTPAVTEVALRPRDHWRVVPASLAGVPPWDTTPDWKKPFSTVCDFARGRAVLFCDSFFRAGGISRDALSRIPLVLRFRQLTSYWEWPNHAMIAQVAATERPDVVIEARTERFLRLVPDDDPEMARARAVTR